MASRADRQLSPQGTGRSIVGAAGEETADEVWVCRSARLSRPAYRFYRAILLTFLEKDDPPDLAALRQLARRHHVPLAATLARMAAQDLVQCDPRTGTTRAAYPFSGVPTAHQLALPTDRMGAVTDEIEVRVYAMCALDALGIPLMLRRSALITSADALTGEPVRALVRPSHPESLTRTASAPSDWIAQWEPTGSVIFARPESHEHEHDCGVAAAGACCPVTNFFTTAEHAREWAAAHTETTGTILTQVEALARADALFGGVLDRLGNTGRSG